MERIYTTTQSEGMTPDETIEHDFRARRRTFEPGNAVALYAGSLTGQWNAFVEARADEADQLGNQAEAAFFRDDEATDTLFARIMAAQNN